MIVNNRNLAAYRTDHIQNTALSTHLLFSRLVTACELHGRYRKYWFCFIYESCIYILVLSCFGHGITESKMVFQVTRIIYSPMPFTHYKLP